jgi:hypothetical protein
VGEYFGYIFFLLNFSIDLMKIIYPLVNNKLSEFSMGKYSNLELMRKFLISQISMNIYTQFSQ